MVTFQPQSKSIKKLQRSKILNKFHCAFGRGWKINGTKMMLMEIHQKCPEVQSLSQTISNYF